MSDGGRKTAESMARAMRVMSVAMREFSWTYMQQTALARMADYEKRKDPAYWRESAPYFQALADMAERMGQGPGALKFLRGLEERAKNPMEVSDDGVGDKTTDQG